MVHTIAFRYFTMISPILLLPSALMVSPTILNHRKLANIFLPPIIAIHGYNLYYLSDFGGITLQFITVLHSLWTLELLIWRDPRRDFNLIHRYPSYVANKSIQNRELINREGTDLQPLPAQHVWQEPYPATIVRRSAWVWLLVWSWRYTNWNTNHPNSTALHKYQPSPAHSSISYIRKTSQSCSPSISA